MLKQKNTASDKHEQQNRVAQFDRNILVACTGRGSISYNEDCRR